MPNRDDNNDEHAVVDCVDDSVIPDTNAKAGSTLELSRTRWARIFAEERDNAMKSWLVFAVYLLQCTKRSGSNLDSIGHCQPRSDFA